MTDQVQPHSTSVPAKRGILRKVIYAALALVAFLVVAVIALRLFIMTGPGLRLIEQQINSRSFGPIAGIEVSGLSGDPLSKFTADSLKIKDPDGVWIDVRNVSLDWSPWALLSHHVKINSLSVKAADVQRRPEFLVTTPSEKEAPNVTAERVMIDALTLQEDLIVQRAVFNISAGGAITDGSKQLNLTAVRTDVAGDKLMLDLSQGETNAIRGQFEILGVANGPLANILRVSNGQQISGQGEIKGTDVTGEGGIIIQFGDQQVADARIDWTASAINLSSQLNISAWPELERVQQSFGEAIEIEMTAQRDRARSFDARILGSRIIFEASGNLPSEGWMPNKADISLRADDLSAIALLPDDYGIKGADITGRINFTPQRQFAGQVKLTQIATPYATAQTISGPVILTQASSNQYAFELDVEGKTLAIRQELPIKIGQNATLKTKGSYNTATQILQLQPSKIVSNNASFSTQGSANVQAVTFNLKGRVDVPVRSLGAVPAGKLDAEYTVIKGADTSPALTTSGTYVPSTALQAPLQDLIGSAIRFNTRMQPIEGGVVITEARVTGDSISGVAEGRITDRLDISAEATTTTAFTYQSVNLGDQADVTMRVTGTRDDPNLRLQATASSIEAGNIVLSDNTLKVEVRDIFTQPKGPAEFTANSEYGSISASTQFASRGDNIIANDIALSVGNVSASGEFTLLPSKLIDGNLSLDIPKVNDDAARAKLVLTPKGKGEQGIELDVSAKNIAYNNIELDNFVAQASGTFASLAGKIELKGRRTDDALARPIAFAAPLSVSRKTGDELVISLSPEGRYGTLQFASRAPSRLSVDAGNVSATAPLLIAEQPVDLSYRRSPGGEEALSVDANNLPISILPLPGNLADSRGRLNIALDIGAKNGRPQGSGTITATDWRGFGMEEGSGINLNVLTDLKPNSADFTLRSSATSGLNASGNLSVPLQTGDSLVALSLNMTAPLSGGFSLAGPAGSVLGLMVPSETDPEGQLNASVNIAGTLSEPRVSGQARGSDMAFEALVLGTQIREGRFTAQFNNQNLSVSDVYFTDNQGGNITGQGQFTLGEFGRPLGKLTITTQQFYALDRRDFLARVSGDVTYESLPKKASLTGNVKILKAEVKQFARGGTSVIEIDVEEINKPGKTEEAPDPRPILPINLYIKIDAPREVFVRSRGLDVELSVNAAIKGTVDNPEIKGRADVIRGGYRLAGKTLNFNEGSVIFDGPVDQARISLKATTKATNLSASVDISGTVGTPEIELSSTPERPDDEILSALLFGRSATELSTIEAAQLAGALAQFSGDGVGFDLMGGLRDSLGVAQLSVGVSEDGSAQIVGGRYLANNVYLRVFSGAGEGQTGAIIDWELRENLSLRSKLQADNEQSLSLSYKKDF
ncbi:translocation/assembly module TamB domain-containing protein [Litorimonas sp. RW-G-Af-16]|uniref:translocation/assembly module TamB domain-containing protein n=1 Tax=Litorimonas sp. RW-G-Af-16 TaxID=3241168 RepID=UPI003AADB7B1